MKQNIEQLKDHNIRATPLRLSVLEVFLKENNAISKQEIEDRLTTIDRISLYRTLKTFEEKGLIHKVLNTSNIQKYAICQDDCSDDAHEDKHVHFECTNCNKTTCLDHVPIPVVALPENYKTQSIALTITGICENCN